MTKREQVRYITNLIRKAKRIENNETVVLGLQDWRNSILNNTSMDPQYSRIVFDATIEMYDEFRRRKREEEDIDPRKLQGL